MNTHPRRFFSALVLLCVAAGGLRGPGTTHAATPTAAMGMYTIKISNFLFPKSVPAGLLQVSVTNDTKAEGEAGFGRLNKGYTTKDVIKALTTNSDQSFFTLLKTVTLLGGPENVQPGQTETAVLTLTPGQYGVVNSDGAKPVYRFFTVTASTGMPMQAPMATASIQLKEMAFVGLPKHLPAGKITLKVTNIGMQTHEIAFVRLDAGKTVQDVLKAIMSNTEPKWAHDAGGMDGLSPHQSAYLTLTFVPGNYAAICFLPDVTKKSYVPHAAEGMVGTFTVS